MLNLRRCQPHCNSPQDFRIRLIGVIEPWCINKDKAPGIPGIVWGEIDDERLEGRSAQLKTVAHLCLFLAQVRVDEL